MSPLKKSTPDVFQEFFVAAQGGMNIQPLTLSMAQIIDATSSKWTNIAFADANHMNTYAFNTLLNNDTLLSSLQKAGVKSFFDEVDVRHSDTFTELELGQILARDFSDAVHVSGWVDNPAHYEQTSYAPLVQNAYAKGVSFKPADVQQEQSIDLEQVREIYLDFYFNTFPEGTFSENDKARILELFRLQPDDATITSPLGNNITDAPKLSDHDKEIVKRFIEHSQTLSTPSDIEFSDQNISISQGSDVYAHNYRSVALGAIMMQVENDVRLAADTDVSRYIEGNAPNEKRAIRFGIAHFSHSGDIDDNLKDRTLIIGVYKNTDEYKNTLSLFKTAPHLAHMLDEGRTYTTEATPPDILESIREKENSAAIHAPKTNLQTDYSISTP